MRRAGGDVTLQWTGANHAITHVEVTAGKAWLSAKFSGG